MSVKTIEEIITSLKEKIGEHPDDNSIAFLEDIADTFTDLEKKAQGDGIDWKAKYEENDADWRKKYTERFCGTNPIEITPKQDDIEKPKAFNDLFTIE